MLDEMRVNDEQLEVSDIRQLESADEIAHFFAKLRYNVDQRTNIPDYAVPEANHTAMMRSSMSPKPKPYLSPEEYLALERTAACKSEYFRGEIFAMAGASPTHVLIVTNIVAALHGQLRRRPCTVYATDLRLKVNASGLYTYPDIAVVCGEPQFDDDQRDTLVNPTLIVEVLSESTQDYDRGGKFAQYRKIPSFAEHVLVAQDECHAEHFVKQADGLWLLAETDRLEDRLTLSSIECTLLLSDIYEKVQFPRL